MTCGCGKIPFPTEQTARAGVSFFGALFPGREYGVYPAACGYWHMRDEAKRRRKRSRKPVPAPTTGEETRRGSS